MVEAAHRVSHVGQTGVSLALSQLPNALHEVRLPFTLQQKIPDA